MLVSRQSGLDALAGLDLCAIPVGSNPNGLPPNFKNAPSLQPVVIAMVALMMPIAIVVTAGRLYANKTALKVADYFMIIGLVLDIGISSVLLALSKNYRHTWDTPICWMDVRYMKLTFVEVLVVGPALFFPKAAIFLFYLQLFSINKQVRIGSKIGLGISFLAYFPTSLVLCYFDAPHIGQTWEELLLSDMPKRGIPGGITIGVASVIVDIYVFVLPLPTIFSLNMALSKRIQLLALFATAFMGVVASVICMVFRIKLLGLQDSGWQSGRVAIAIIVENNVAIIVGSLPAFANFLRVHVSESAFYKSLRSKISGSHIYDSKQENSGQLPIQTFGSPHKRQPEWHELSDSAILNSQITIPDRSRALSSPHTDSEGITRTFEFSREEHARQSSERLV